ncbi:MAG TPA: glycosyltransferase [Opitutaceae bacterium]|nr:glycosyltransferase [Opitutaceae bacterium]
MNTVDVIIPCYKYAHFLRDCVQSVLTQTGAGVRVLIIDDCSPDNTPEIASQLVKEDSRVTYHRHEKNKRHIATYNEGIDWASSEYSLLLSADDYILPGSLGRAVAMMDADPSIGFSFGKALILTPDGKLQQSPSAIRWTGDRVLSGQAFLDIGKSNNIVLTPTAVVRTALQKKLGGYRSELPHSADAEMWWRLAAHSSVGVIDNNQAVYRRHSANMSLSYATSLIDLKERQAAVKYFFEACASSMPNADALYKTFTMSLARDAVGYASEAFNINDKEACRKLLDFAVSVCPDVKHSAPWYKLLAKRCMGGRMWRALRPKASNKNAAAAN